MKKCTKCNVYINSNKRVCPLCDELLVGTNDLDMPKYPNYKTVLKHKSIFIRIIAFISILCSAVCVVTNYFTYSEESGWWVLYILLGFLYMWILLANTIHSKTNVAVKLIMQMLGLSALMLGIDIFSNGGGWSYNYVIPFINIITTISIIIISLAKKAKFGDYLFYLFLSIVIGFVLVVLYAFKVINILWPSLSAGSLSLATVLGLFLFADKETSDEFKKKFHV